MHTYARSCPHMHAHMSANMLLCTIVPACACSMLGAITSTCVGIHDCDPAHVHNASATQIIPELAPLNIPGSLSFHICSHHVCINATYCADCVLHMGHTIDLMQSIISSFVLVHANYMNFIYLSKCISQIDHLQCASDLA
jgi:hypothetical protein